MNDTDLSPSLSSGLSLASGRTLAQQPSSRRAGASAHAVRFAAFFSDELSARAALDQCLITGVGGSDGCRLLRADRSAAAAQLPGSDHPRAGLSALVLATLAGAAAGAVMAGLAGSFFVGVLGSISGETAGLQRAATAGAFTTCAAFGAVLGAALAAWLAFNAESARNARRFDGTVLRRLRQGDSAVVLSGLSGQRLAALVAALEVRCQRWCHDAGAPSHL